MLLLVIVQSDRSSAIVDIRPDMSCSTLRSIRNNLKKKRKQNLKFKATGWGKEVKDIIAKEIDRRIQKIDDELRVHGVPV